MSARGLDRMPTGKQPQRGVAYRGQLHPTVVEAALRAKAEEKKLFRDKTWTEKWADRRWRWLSVMPLRFAPIDAKFDKLLNVANQEYYEFTPEEAASLVARLRARVDALEQSFKAGKVVYPSEQPVVTLDQSLAPPDDAIAPAAGLEDIW